MLEPRHILLFVTGLFVTGLFVAGLFGTGLCHPSPPQIQVAFCAVSSTYRRPRLLLTIVALLVVSMMVASLAVGLIST